MKSRLFDVNVYVIDGVVKVIFYKLIYADAMNGTIVGADTTEKGEAGRIELNIHSQNREEIEAIRYALDSDDYDDRPLNEWEEFDYWNTSEWFMQGESPKIFRDFTNGLQEYEPEIGHAWELVVERDGLPSQTTLRCRCGVTA